jgi:NitT/TauT family transport system substrate-binding protein
MTSCTGGAAPAARSESATSAVQATSPQTPPLTNVKHQHPWFLERGALGYFVAIEKGWYGEEGLEVEVLPGGPNVNAVQAVMGGLATIGVTDAEPAAAARSQGLPIRIIGARLQQAPNAVICRADAGVNTPQDLVGKRVGVTPKDQAILNVALRFAGVAPDSVQLSGTGQDLGPLITQQMDCRYGFINNEPLGLEQQGVATRSFTLWDLGIKEQGAIHFTSEETLTSQRDVLVRYMRASTKGWQWSIDHPEEALRLLVDKYTTNLDYDKQLSTMKVDVSLMLAGAAPQRGLLSLDRDSWKDTLVVLEREGVLGRAVSVDELLDVDVMRAAREPGR